MKYLIRCALSGSNGFAVTVVHHVEHTTAYPPGKASIGTVIAISSLACGTPLLYWALFLFVRKWLKSERRLVQWLLNIALVCYSALSTFTLLFGASRI